MDTLLTKLFEVFSVEFMFSVIVASYFVIKLVDTLNGKRIIPTWLKRVITCLVGMVLFVVFYKFTEITLQSLIASFFSAIFVYDTAIKTLMQKFNIDYKK
jgi:hypothetical protein